MSKTLRGLLFMGLLATLAACAQYSDNSLATDAKADECPPGCASSLKAESTKISVKIMNNTVNMQSGETRADISGDCYPSLFPKNTITVKVLNSSNTTSYGVYYYGLGADVNTVSCVNGRFNFTVDMSTLPAGAYNIQATMVAYDASNKAYSNPADGVSYVTVRK